MNGYSKRALLSRSSNGFSLACGPRFVFFFSRRRRHTSSVSAFLLNRSSDLDDQSDQQGSQDGKGHAAYARRQFEDRKSGSAGMPRPISYAVFCLKKKKKKRKEKTERRKTEVDSRLECAHSNT